MATDVVKVKYSLEDDYSKNIDKISKKTESFDNTLKEVNKSLGQIALASSAFTAIGVGAISKTIKAWDAQLVAQQRLETSLKNQGIVNEQYAKGLFDIASNLQNYANIADEETLPIIQQLTDAFGANVLQQKSLQEVQELVFGLTDTAVAKNVSLETVIRAVANATEGNTGSLSRYGIKLEEGSSKLDVFNQLVEKSAKFQGQAGLEAQTFSGRIIALGLAFDDALEPIGKFIQDALKPYAEQLITIVRGSIDWASANADLLGTTLLLGTAISGMVASLATFGWVSGNLVFALKSLSGILTPFVAFFTSMKVAIVGAVIAVGKLITGFGILSSFLTGLVASVIGVATAITVMGDSWDEFFNNAIDMAYKFAQSFGQVITNALFSAIRFVIGGIPDLIENVFYGIINFFSNFGKATESIFTGIVAIISGLFSGVSKNIKANLLIVLDEMVIAYNKLVALFNENSGGLITIPEITQKRSFRLQAVELLRQQTAEQKAIPKFADIAKSAVSFFKPEEQKEKQEQLKTVTEFRGTQRSESYILPDGRAVTAGQYEALRGAGQLGNFGVIESRGTERQFLQQGSFRPIQINVSGGVIDNKNTTEALAKALQKYLPMNDKVRF